MNLLVFKLLITPLLVAAVTLAGRRWGSGVSGWLVGLPLTSAPVSVFLALQHGRDFAVHAAVGALAGISASAVFCLVYALLARKTRWTACIGGATLAFLLVIGLYNHFSLALLPTILAVYGILALIYQFMPRRSTNQPPAVPPAWDIPARILFATAFVVLLTGFSGLLGAQLSGLLSPYPVFTSTLGAFTHRQQGREAAIQFMRGVVRGAFSYASFFVVVALALNPLGMLWAYALGVAAIAAVNGLSLHLGRVKIRAEASL